MKMMVALFCISVLLTGCATTDSVQRYNDMTRKYTIHIISEPSGAKIEINGNYIGTTPTDYTVACKLDPYLYAYGNVPMYNSASLTVQAYPLTAGQQVQSKYLTIDPTKPESIPSTIYFDMNLVASEPTINVNVNQ